MAWQKKETFRVVRCTVGMREQSPTSSQFKPQPHGRSKRVVIRAKEGEIIYSWSNGRGIIPYGRNPYGTAGEGKDLCQSAMRKSLKKSASVVLGYVLPKNHAEEEGKGGSKFVIIGVVHEEI